MPKSIELHGARLLIPDDWEDISIYRFLPPEDEEEPALISAKKAKRAQPNVVITRHALARGDTAAKFLEEINARALAENKTFRVLSSGTKPYLGQNATWQEISQTAPEPGLTVQQRHVVLPGHAGELVLITITGDKKQVAAMSAAIGFDAQS